MKLELILILLLLGIVYQGIGQEDIRPVEIVLSNGTIRTGEISNDKWQAHNKQFIFRPEEDKSPIFIGVGSIVEMTIGEEPEMERYFGYKGPVIQFSDKIDLLPEGEEVTYKEDTILLKALVLGTANLYSYVSLEGTEHFFVSREGTELIELITFRYRLSETDRRIRHHDHFITQLQELLPDCGWIKDWIEDIEVEESELKDLFIEYNSCDEQKSLVYVNALLKRKLSAAIALGGAFTRVSRKEDQIINIGTGQLTPRLGLSAKLTSKYNPDIQAFLLEVLYSPFSTYDEAGEIDVQSTYLQTNILYQSSWQSAKNWPYFLAGLSYNARLSTKKQNGLPAQVLVDHMPGLLVGFGVQSGRFRMGLRYEVNNLGLLFPQSPSYYANTLSLMAAYTVLK